MSVGHKEEESKHEKRFQQEVGHGKKRKKYRKESNMKAELKCGWEGKRWRITQAERREPRKDKYKRN